MSQSFEISDNLHFMLIAKLKRVLSDVSRSVSWISLRRSRNYNQAPLTVQLRNLFIVLRLRKFNHFALQSHRSWQDSAGRSSTALALITAHWITVITRGRSDFTFYWNQPFGPILLCCQMRVSNAIFQLIHETVVNFAVLKQF